MLAKAVDLNVQDVTRQMEIAWNAMQGLDLSKETVLSVLRILLIKLKQSQNVKTVHSAWPVSQQQEIAPLVNLALNFIEENAKNVQKECTLKVEK